MMVFAVFKEVFVTETENLIGERQSAEYEYDELIGIYAEESSAQEYVATQVEKHRYRIDSYELK